MNPNPSSASFTPALAKLLATVSVAFVVTQLDVTIVNIALAKLGTDLHAGVAGLQWIVDAYTLAFAVLMLSAGLLGDRFGTRRMFGAGIALFALSSLACGLAANATTLVAARAIQGIGAAAMLPNSLALLNQACRHDPTLRARAVGLWTASGAISIAAGPVIGGLLIAGFGWRSIFLVNLPLCALGLWATWAWVPQAPGKSMDLSSTPLRQQPGAVVTRPASEADATASRSHAGGHAGGNSGSHAGGNSGGHSHGRNGIDLPGQLLAIVALTSFTGAMIEGRPLGIGHPLVFGGLVLAIVAAVAFVMVEARAAQPMVPLSFFRDRTFSAAVLFGICVNLTYYGTVFVLSLYLQQARGYTALQAGIAFLPLTGGFLISNVASGWVTGHYGVRVPMVIGGLIGALGYGLLHFVDAQTPIALVMVPFLLIPSGMGLAVPAMTTAVLASVEPKRAGTASAVLNTARQSAGAVGVALFGAFASGGTAEHVVFGLHASTLVAVCLLLTGAVLGRLVHPHPHVRREQTDRSAAPANAG